MRAKGNQRKIATIVQMRVFKWPLICRRGCLSSLLLRLQPKFEQMEGEVGRASSSSIDISGQIILRFLQGNPTSHCSFRYSLLLSMVTLLVHYMQFTKQPVDKTRQESDRSRRQPEGSIFVSFYRNLRYQPQLTAGGGGRHSSPVACTQPVDDHT